MTVVRFGGEVEKDKAKMKEKNDTDVEKQRQRDTWAQREMGSQRDPRCFGFIQLPTSWFVAQKVQLPSGSMT